MYTEFFEGPRFPTDEESQAFIAAYEEARGTPFTSDEQQTLQAAKIVHLPMVLAVNMLSNHTKPCIQQEVVASCWITIDRQT